MSKTKSLAPAPATPLRPTTIAMLEELDGWRARHPPATDLQRRVFTERYPDAFRERLASSTKARGTLKNAMSWLRTLHPATGRISLGDVGITPATMALFIESTRALVLAVETLDTGASDESAVQREAAREAVNTLYGDTREQVNESIGQNETWRKQLDDALTSRRHDELDADAARLLRLADAIKAWFDGRDAGAEVIQASLVDEGVTRETVGRCVEVAGALVKALAHATPKPTGRDTPLVNRAEGAVLALMLLIYRKVNKARAKKGTALVLKPDTATRRVLAPNVGRRKKQDKGAPDDAATPAAEAAPARATTRTKKRRPR